MIIQKTPEWAPLHTYARNTPYRLPAHRLDVNKLYFLLLWTMRSDGEDPVAAYPITIEGVAQTLKSTTVTFLLHAADDRAYDEPAEDALRLSRTMTADRHISTTHPTDLYVPEVDQAHMVSEAIITSSYHDWNGALRVLSVPNIDLLGE